MKQQTQIFHAIFAVFLSTMPLLTQTATAQDPPPVATQAPAPVEQALAKSVVPTQIATAHTIFLSNVGADTGFPIDNNSYFNAIYDGLKDWGKYHLVDTPQEADLIFELHGVSTYTEYAGDRGGTYTINNPSFVLTIFDAKTKVTLWTSSAPVYLDGHGTTLTRWVHIAEERVVSQVKILAGQPLSATETADLNSFPKGHAARTLAIIGGTLAVVGVGTFLIVHHEMDEFNAQETKQYQTCIAEGFTPTQCQPFQ